MTTIEIKHHRWIVILTCDAPPHEVAIKLRQEGARVTRTRDYVRATITNEEP